MTDPRWKAPLTIEQMQECLGIACHALDTIAGWSEEDDAAFGSPSTFAKTLLDRIHAGGFRVEEAENKDGQGGMLKPMIPTRSNANAKR